MELGRFGFLGGCFYTLTTLLSWKICSFEELDHGCTSSFITERTKDTNEKIVILLYLVTYILYMTFYYLLLHYIIYNILYVCYSL